MTTAGRVLRMAGFSLVELMAALVIGVLAIGGALRIYSRASSTYRTADIHARLQENARYAIALVAGDVQSASFWGMHGKSSLLTVNAASSFPATCGANWVTDVNNYLTGQNNSYTLPCAASGGGARAGADTLIVRRASSQRMSPQSAIIPARDRTRALIVTNHLAGEIFVSSYIGNGIPAGYAMTDPANAPPLADTRELLAHAYYVSRDSSVAMGYPALRRKHLTSGPSITDEEMLPGVEDLQVQFGIDTNADGSADQFLNPGTVPAGGRVVSAKVWLRLRAIDPDSAYIDDATYAYADQTWTAPGDSFRRLLVQQTLYLRNSAP